MTGYDGRIWIFMANYYFQFSEKARGPFSLSEVELLARTKQILPSTNGCLEGESEWQPAGVISEIKPILRATRCRQIMLIVYIAMFASLAVIVLFGKFRNPRWEYKVVDLENKWKLESALTPMLDRSPGADGWEVVAVVNQGDSRPSIIYKRRE